MSRHAGICLDATRAIGLVAIPHLRRLLRHSSPTIGGILVPGTPSEFGEAVVPHLLEELADDDGEMKQQPLLICYMLDTTARPALPYLREMLAEVADDEKREEGFRELIRRVKAE